MGQIAPQFSYRVRNDKSQKFAEFDNDNKVLQNEGANFKLMNRIVALFLNRKYNIEVKMGGLLSNKNEELFLKL